MRLLLLSLVLFSGVTPLAHAQTMEATQRKLELEIQRIDQRVSRLNDQNEQHLRNIRELQRENEELKRQVEFMSKKAGMAIDDVTKMRNTDVANLVATDKQLAEQIRVINAHIEDQTPTWDWGSRTRDCENVGKHLQIQSVRSGDGTHTLRYLCFDGRPLHLGTEVNLPPQ